MPAGRLVIVTPPTARPPNALVGASGEYHVAAELSHRGWLATVTIKNAPGTDVLAQHFETGLTIPIQVKTTLTKRNVTLQQKDEAPDTADRQWYVLVALAELGARPDFYVLPRNHVCAFIWVDHRSWLAGVSPTGRPRKDSARRNLYLRDLEGYRERWDALVRPPSEMRLDAPSWFAAGLSVHGLPGLHPGISPVA